MVGCFQPRDGHGLRGWYSAVDWTTEDTEYTGVDGVLGAMVFGFGPSTLPPLLR